MSRGLALVWQLVDGTTFFSSRSPPALFAEFFMSSWEDSWAQRASATCRTWVKSGERKEKDEGNNSLHREWQILGDARTVSAPAAYIHSVHHNLSQSSTGHILQRHGRLKQHLKQSSFKFGKVKHLNLIWCCFCFAHKMALWGRTVLQRTGTWLRSWSSKLRASEIFSSSKDRRAFSLSFSTIKSLSSSD